MEKIKDFFETLSMLIEDALSYILSFLNGDMYILYGAIGIILAITCVVGLLTCFKKMPKIFTILIAILAILVAFWYFGIYSGAL